MNIDFPHIKKWQKTFRIILNTPPLRRALYSKHCGGFNFKSKNYKKNTDASTNEQVENNYHVYFNFWEIAEK